MNHFLSQKFRFYSFVAMLLLVYVHGYNLQDTYLQPWSMVAEPMTFTAFLEYLLANGLFRFRIPMLFIISGYLYALGDDKPYLSRTLKRLRTLGIPYLAWAFLALLLTYFLEMIPVFREAIRAAGFVHVQFSDKEIYPFVHDYTWQIWLGRIVLVPIAFQLWFIRVLLFYNIAYPALRWCVVRYPAVWFVVAGLLWFSTFGVFFFEGEGLFFFTLGVWIQKNKFDITTAPRYLRPRVWGVVFILCALIKTYIAFEGAKYFGKPNTDGVLFAYGLTILVLFKITEISGLISIWYGADVLVRWANGFWLFRYSQSFSFIIYAIHVPILYYVMYIAVRGTRDFAYHRLLTFALVPLLVIVFAICLGAILKRGLPPVYSLLTGGR